MRKTKGTKNLRIKEEHMTAKNFDLIVIGTGSAGLTVANKCRAKGLTVAIIDEKPYGGTCALRGCDPKKILVGFAEVLDQFNRYEGIGLSGTVKADWEEMIKYKNKFTSPVPHKREDMLQSHGITTLHGTASFTGKNTITVENETYSAKNFVIATGAKAMDLPFEGNDHLIDNEQFLNLQHLPEKLLFVGGGFISMEFAHISARAGADVTVINNTKQILNNFDHDLASLLEERSRELGINIINNSTVKGIYKRGNTYVVKYDSPQGEKQCEADLAVHGAGRAPNIGNLNLEAANVEYDERGVEVNKFLQSVSNSSVYAAGDVAKGGLQLTPVASFEAHIVSSNILRGNSKTTEYPVIPSVVYTVPHLASVGLTEEEAKAKGIKYNVNFAQTSDWYSAMRINEKYEAYKILMSEDEKHILGAHILGHRADDLINTITVAIHNNMEASDIKKIIFAYPSAASNLSYMI
jgi:glutathione reductase (NADPH)